MHTTTGSTRHLTMCFLITHNSFRPYTITSSILHPLSRLTLLPVSFAALACNMLQLSFALGPSRTVTRLSGEKCCVMTLITAAKLHCRRKLNACLRDSTEGMLGVTPHPSSLKNLGFLNNTEFEGTLVCRLA